MGKNLKEAGNVVTTPLDRKKGKEVLIEDKPAYFVHVDADRDGKVDDVTVGLDKWEWGKGKKGAIVLVNNDRDGATAQTTDHADDVVNGVDDLPDVAPLQIRRRGATAAPAGWTGKLSVPKKLGKYIRIFETRTASAKEVIGPTAGVEHSVGALDFAQKELGMEATEYPNKTFDGQIPITWTVLDGTKVISTQVIVVRVAPWIVFNHSHETKKVYVADSGDNARFRTDLDAEIARAKATPSSAEVVMAMGRFPGQNDRWMQDIMEIGFSTLPGQQAKPEWSTPVVLRTARDRANYRSPTQNYPRETMLAPNFGFTQTVVPGAGSSQDSFGNLECSPPIKTKSGKEYLFGRIVYGTDAIPVRNMHATVQDFLAAQRVQAPIKVDTGWLQVGHVDEVFSFCPMSDASQKFRVLIASPTKAWKILEDLRAAKQDTLTLLESYNPGGNYPYRSVADVLDNLKADQVVAQGKIDSIRKALKSELNLKDSDFIDLPVLFIGAEETDKVRRHIAYTPGVVNMLVITRPDKTVHLVIPKPFGPKVGTQCQFEKDIDDKLSPYAAEVTHKYVDDFEEYHAAMGEIHCGTNSLRVPPIDRFWWEQTT